MSAAGDDLMDLAWAAGVAADAADEPIPYLVTADGDALIEHLFEEARAGRPFNRHLRLVDTPSMETFTHDPSCELCLDSRTVLRVDGGEPHYEACPWCSLEGPPS